MQWLYVYPHAHDTYLAGQQDTFDLLHRQIRKVGVQDVPGRQSVIENLLDDSVRISAKHMRKGERVCVLFEHIHARVFDASIVGGGTASQLREYEATAAQ
jgi:hypothetical protein